MGRRALHKIDPSLNLGDYLYSIQQQPEGFEPQALYETPRPLEIEIGSGKGLFLVSACQERPDTNFLGVEIRYKYAEYTASRLARRKLDNGRVLHGDGAWLLRECLPDAQAAAVHVYFPDPWWKARHRKRRVLNPAFLMQVQRVLQTDGRLHFWTDVEEYFQTTLEVIAEHTQLQGPLAVPERQPEHDMDYRTNFERRKRMHGHRIYRAEFRRE